MNIGSKIIEIRKKKKYDTGRFCEDFSCDKTNCF